MNPQVEDKALEHAKDWFKRHNFTVGHCDEGYDFMAEKDGQKFPVEVKGHSNGKLNGSQSLTTAQLQLLKRDPNARLAIVVVNGPLSIQNAMELYSGQDIVREEPETYLVHLRQKRRAQTSL